MRVRFLGTGTSTGIPLIGCNCAVCTNTHPYNKRLRTSLLLQSRGLNIVFDCGPDFRQQILEAKINTLDGLVFTHQHSDHTAGLDEVRAFTIWNKKPVNVYASQIVQTELKRNYSYVFLPPETKYPGAADFSLCTIEKVKPFSIGHLDLIPIEANHGFVDVLGFRIGDFAYMTDVKYIYPDEIKKLAGVKYLIINALQHEPHYSHLSLTEALAIVRQLQPQQAYLTHISHKLGLYADVAAILPPNVHVAYDGLEIAFDFND